MTPARPGQPSPAQRPSRRSGRRKYPLSAAEHQICSEVGRLRVEWALSQSQFARLLNTSVRTVKRWESHSHKPTPDVRIILASFQDYIAAHGLDAFRERFVREEPRRGKPGPAERLIDLAFDARVAGPVRRLDPPAASARGAQTEARTAESPESRATLPPEKNVSSARGATAPPAGSADPPSALATTPVGAARSALPASCAVPPEASPAGTGTAAGGVRAGVSGAVQPVRAGDLVPSSGDNRVKNGDFRQLGASGLRVVNDRDRTPAMDRRLAGAPPLDPRKVVIPGLGVKIPCIRREP